MTEFELNDYLRDISDEDFIADLRFVASELDRSPTATEYNRIGKYHSSTLARRFGKWTDALKRAELGPTRSVINIPTEQLLQNIEEVWIKLGRQPTYSDMNSSLSLFSAKTYGNRFGGWRSALEVFVSSVADGEDAPESRLLPAPSADPSPRSRTRHINWRTRFKVLQRDRFTCVSCGRSPAKDPSVELHIDHIMPWSRGGESSIENLQTLCSMCNIGKSNLEE